MKLGAAANLFSYSANYYLSLKQSSIGATCSNTAFENILIRRRKMSPLLNIIRSEAALTLKIRRV